MLRAIKICSVCLLVFLDFFNCYAGCFNVGFRNNYDVQVEPYNTQAFKREQTQFFDKASFSFNGFNKIGSVPVLFPLDICLINMEGIQYAASLHLSSSGDKELAVHKLNNGTYELLADIPTPNATAMDCISIGAKGYVAVAFNLTTPVENAKDGSPIFEIAGNRIRAVQYFSAMNLRSVFLRSTGNQFFLLQTFHHTNAIANLDCPFFKWSGSTFNKLGSLPCSNARHLEPFSIDYENYVAIANYADGHGRTDTNSEIYKYNNNKGKFELHQKIRTNGAVDVKYFSVPYDASKRQHFLIFGNSLSAHVGNSNTGDNLEADSIFYIYDKDKFMPYQRLSFYNVEQFLPIQNMDAEKFLLLVACEQQDIKIYNLNDWKFEESTAQFTEGALGRGISKMRIYQETENTYLVIANELMADNETNIFAPIFKQDEGANALRQQIIEWVHLNTARLQRINVDVLTQALEAKLSKLPTLQTITNVREIPQANIQRVVTKSFVQPRLNLNTHYWKAISYAKQAFDELQHQYGATRLKRSTESPEQMTAHQFEIDTRNVDVLIVRNKLKAHRINDVSADKPVFKSVKAMKVIVEETLKTPSSDMKERGFNTDESADDVLPEIKAQNLLIEGNLNELSWDILHGNTLKRNGVQFLKAEARIQELQAEATTTSNNQLNGESLSKLISVNNGNFVVQQDIQFAAPVTANQVFINDRLNNIHVNQQKFDVLLRRSNETQIVEGPKRFQHLKVLQPVTISGQTRGEHFNSLAPSKPIHETLVLNGNYTIQGDVRISKFLQAADMLGPNNISIGHAILANAVSVNEPLENLNIKFTALVSANNSIVSFVNRHDVQLLVKLDTEEVQALEGEKIFKHTLEIQNGFSEVRILNGIDVEQLETRLFLKDINQTIDVPLHFGNILAKGVNASTIVLANKNVSQFLTRTSDQHIQGQLRVGNLSAQYLLLENLNVNGRIFNRRLDEIYQQKTKSAPNAEILHKRPKFYGSIFVKNLRLNSTINGRAVTDLERQLSELDGNIKYVGDFKFNYDMNITNLTFSGKLNGIPASEFGKSWLQKVGDQVFAAPQTFASIACENNIILNGKLNGLNIDDFYEKTYWINRKEYISNAIFQNPIQFQGALTTDTLNDVRIPEDILYRSSTTPQILYGPVIVRKDLHVKGSILNVSHVNDFELATFDQFLDARGYDTLHLTAANFTYAPQFNTLNYADLKRTLDAAWLVNEDVDLPPYVELAAASFDGLLQFEGPINGVDLNYVSTHCLSLSKPQNISTELIFAGNVKLHGDASATHLHLLGSLVESSSKSKLNFDAFVSNTLKTAGQHEVRAVWNLQNTTVYGDLENVRINDLDVSQDVVRLDAGISEIMALKMFNAATIQKLYITPGSRLNGIPMDDWIRSTVSVYDNATINGITTLDSVNVLNGIHVQGAVNNLSFNEQTLLLKDRNQVLRGNVSVLNQFGEEQRDLPNNFENLQTEYINGMNLSDFFMHRAVFAPSVIVKNHLVFMQPLPIKSYRGLSVDDTKSIKFKRGTTKPADATNISNGVSFEMERDTLPSTKKGSQWLIDHFEIRQVLNIKAANLIYFSEKMNEGVGISQNGDSLAFYRFDKRNQKFLPIESLSTPAQHETLRSVSRWLMTDDVNSSIEKAPIALHNMTPDAAHDLWKALESASTLTNGKVATVQLQNKSCLAVCDNRSKVPIYCLTMKQPGDMRLNWHKKMSIGKANVKQVLDISKTALALLYIDGVEIWNTSKAITLQQRLDLSRCRQLAIDKNRGTIYLAVLTEQKFNNLLDNTIEIFRSTAISSFEHFQRLKCSRAQQVSFSPITSSGDLLLHVVTTDEAMPLWTYQLKGVMGFVNILDKSVLAPAWRMQIVHLEVAGNYLIALFNANSITFVEIILRKI